MTAGMSRNKKSAEEGEPSPHRPSGKSSSIRSKNVCDIERAVATLYREHALRLTGIAESVTLNREPFGGHENRPTGGQQILHGDEHPEWRI